jgi:hypothetical protein
LLGTLCLFVTRKKKNAVGFVSLDLYFDEDFMFSFNPKKWGLPQPWYYRFKFDRGHGRWVIELQENGHDWNALTMITNNKLETADFPTLQLAVDHAKAIGLPEAYTLYGIETLPEFETSSILTGAASGSESGSATPAASSLRAV